MSLITSAWSAPTWRSSLLTRWVSVRNPCRIGLFCCWEFRILEGGWSSGVGSVPGATAQLQSIHPNQNNRVGCRES